MKKTIKISKQACDLDSLCIRLHRINGQVSAIEKMLNEKRDFIDILQQLVAARQALDKVATLIVASQANGCFESHKANDAKKELNRIATALFKIT